MADRNIKERADQNRNWEFYRLLNEYVNTETCFYNFGNIDYYTRIFIFEKIIHDHNIKEHHEGKYFSGG